MKSIRVILELIIVFFRVILFKLGWVVKPYKICWLITWRCNLACHYCEIGQANRKELKDQELSFEEIKRIIPEFKGLGVKFITFAGGEPLMYEDIFKVIRLCKAEGFIVGLVTNGTMITENIAKELAISGVDHIHISLDFPGVLQNEIRNNQNCFMRIDSAIKSLLKYKHIGNYHIGIVSVVSGLNFDKLEEVFLYAKRYNLDSVALQPFFVNQMRNKDMAEKFSIPLEKIPDLREKINYLLSKYKKLMRTSTFYLHNIANYFLDPKVKGTTCFGGGLTINILPDGTLGACYYLQSKEAGTLRDKKLSEIIHTSAYRNLLKRVRRRDCPTCWCAVVHEFNLFFRPFEILRSLRLLEVAKDGR